MQKSIGSRKKKYFSKRKERLLKLPDLLGTQKESYKEFIETRLWKAFQSYTPLQDHNGVRFDLEFVSFKLEEPKITEREAVENSETYGYNLKVSVRLKNKTVKTTKTQEISFGLMPKMTTRGSFIIKGIERIVASQIVRSYGIAFGSSIIRNVRCFNAKVMPMKGGWLEIESDRDNIFHTKINRGGRIYITSLLRVFGCKKDSDILALAPNKEVKEALQKTIEKDPIKTYEEAYVHVYEKIRSGSQATFEAAQKYIDQFFSAESLDISVLGRHRFNKMLGSPTTEKELKRLNINAKDIAHIIAEIVKKNSDPTAVADDIDHLSRRRVRSVGEILELRSRMAIRRLARNIQDKMTTADANTTVPINIINPSTFQFTIRDFFATDALSHLVSQKNILDEVEHRRTVTALGPGGLTREHASVAVRDLHPSHYGRICPVHTPEGANIGLNLHLSLYAKANRFGILETPYAEVVNGVVTKKIVYMDAETEEQYKIANGAAETDENGKIMYDKVIARYKGDPVVIPSKNVDYIDVSTDQIFSIASSLIPFAEHNATHRSLLGSITQRQAVSSIRPEAPLVATGLEEDVAKASGKVVIAEEDGTIEGVDGLHIKLKTKDGKTIRYEIEKFLETNGNSVHHQKPIVSIGDKVKKGQVIADCAFSDNGQLAIGQNLRVAFVHWYGNNYEDAQVISQKVLSDDRYTSTHIKHFDVNVLDTKLGPEVTSFDIPNVSEQRLRNLDEEGVIRIGAEVSSGDILVGKVTPKGETQLTPEERLLRSIFGDTAKDVKDTSFKVPAGIKGRIINVTVFDKKSGYALDAGVNKTIKITIAQLRPISIGDKLTGRHGNKGLISQILPEEDMPFTEDGKPIDIILSPLGIPSRLNLGQIFETHLGLVAQEDNYQAIVPSFAGVTQEEIQEEYKRLGMSSNGKQKLYDGNTGELLAQEVTVGYMYLLKLEHMVEDKIQSRSIGKYSVITQQPLPGKKFEGGLRTGEMEVWALLGYGAAYNLREMLTIKSDDMYGRSAAYDAIIKGERINNVNLPATFNVFINYLRGLGLDVKLTKE